LAGAPDTQAPQDGAQSRPHLLRELVEGDGALARIFPLLLALSGAVIVLLALVVGEQALEGGARRANPTTMERVLNSTAERLSEWRDRQITEARIWAGTQLIGEAVPLLAEETGREALAVSPHQEAVRRVLQPWITQQGFTGYYILDADGRLLAAEDNDGLGEAGQPGLSSRELEALRQGRPVVSRPVVHETPDLDFRRTEDGRSETVVILIAAPIVRDGRYLGAMVLEQDAFGGYSSIFSVGRTGQTGETYAVDRDGLMLSVSKFEPRLRELGLLDEGHSSLLHVRVSDPGPRPSAGDIPPEDERPLTLAAQGVAEGRRGSEMRGYRDYRGEAVIGIWVWDEGAELGLITEVDIWEAYAGLGQARAVLRLFGVAMAVLLFVLAGLFSLHRTLLQRRQRALENAERRHRQILTAAGEGIYGIDADGRVTFVNPAACDMLGFTEEELKGEMMELKILHSGRDGEPRPADAPALHDISLREPIRSGEGEVFWTKDGDRLPVQAISTPIIVEGEAIGAVVTFSDLSQHKRDEAALRRYAHELKRSNSELQDFAYAASHDLQEPLRKIQAFGERLNSKYSSALDESGRHYLSRMVEAATRMRRLIDDLLSYSRVNTRSTSFLPVNLNSVLMDVMSDLEPRLEAAGAKVRVGDLPAVEADPGQMHQIFQNLLSNALKFRREGVTPSITVEGDIEAGQDGAMARIAVADNGIGFDPRHAERIFGMFERLHGREEYDGTGVGLATCRKIADRHGGKLAAWGEPGAGAVFTLTLPIRQASSI
jgi:PAS domain S-box-containing protein